MATIGYSIRTQPNQFIYASKEEISFGESKMPTIIDWNSSTRPERKVISSILKTNIIDRSWLMKKRLLFAHDDQLCTYITADNILLQKYAATGATTTTTTTTTKAATPANPFMRMVNEAEKDLSPMKPRKGVVVVAPSTGHAKSASMSLQSKFGSLSPISTVFNMDSKVDEYCHKDQTEVVDVVEEEEEDDEEDDSDDIRSIEKLTIPWQSFDSTTKLSTSRSLGGFAGLVSNHRNDQFNATGAQRRLHSFGSSQCSMVHHGQR
jgi:hypothetical protein